MIHLGGLSDRSLLANSDFHTSMQIDADLFLVLMAWISNNSPQSPTNNLYPVPDQTLDLNSISSRKEYDFIDDDRVLQLCPKVWRESASKIWDGSPGRFDGSGTLSYATKLCLLVALLAIAHSEHSILHQINLPFASHEISWPWVNVDPSRAMVNLKSLTHGGVCRLPHIRINIVHPQSTSSRWYIVLIFILLSLTIIWHCPKTWE